ncbi:MAG: hypothetical protein H0T48_02255 [Gemmatimonadaceae bacterium]|nr:hypothetical protein [Gemmatimonadaceae bacterium]
MGAPESITVAHVQAVHDAAHAFEEGAAKRQDRMPSSAQSMRETAARLREVEGLPASLPAGYRREQGATKVPEPHRAMFPTYHFPTHRRFYEFTLLSLTTCLLIAGGSAATETVSAQASTRSYREGPVIVESYLRTKPGMFDKTREHSLRQC